MADPTNTPMPQGTPIPASTPRSSSPVPGANGLNGANATNGINGLNGANGTDGHNGMSGFNGLNGISTTAKPRVLHIGDPIKYNFATYANFSAQFDVIRPSTLDRSRLEFIRALKERRWGDFDAIFRPFWGTGGEMGLWDAELVELLPESVKVFASAGAGFDWADTKLLGSRGIIYCNSGLAAAEAVADFGVAMIISTFRHLPWCITAASSRDPAAFKDCHARATAASHNLRGHALGIIGLGNIGQQLATRLRHGFAMEIHYHDVERKPAALEAGLKATFHESLESLIRASDCVVLCTPSGGKVINAETLGWFKRGGRFVNVARGSLVDEEALADALEDGRLGTVALDVHESEPRVHPRLLKFAGERAMLTCHNAGGTVETHKGFEELSMRNIMAVLAGDEAITPVNMQYLVRK